MQIVQEDCGWRRVDCLVSCIKSRMIEDPAIVIREGVLNHQHRTPAAAAVRSTIRRLREIAEV